MNEINISHRQFLLITERLSQFYINNENALSFLENNHYKIPLQNYLCICYGIEKNSISKARKIEFFRFIGTIEGQHGYWVQSYSLPTTEEMSTSSSIPFTPSSVFRIQDCNHLRQNIFEFQDKTSLFRSTLFFVPEEDQLFRIHSVLQFITLPVYPSYSFDTTIHPEKFLVTETKKKQILKRLQNQMTLLEQSLQAHGSLERALSEPDNKKQCSIISSRHRSHIEQPGYFKIEPFSSTTES